MHDTAAMTERASTSPAVGAPARSAALRSANRRYFTCLVLLLAAACVLPVSANFLGAYFRKLPLPTKKPLPAMDALALLPRFALAPPEMQPRPLPHEEVENLGTENYLMWQVLDREKKAGDAASRAHIFLSYYTGKPDMVPHNPEECNAAAGFTLAGKQTIEVETIGPSGGPIKVPVAVLEFDPPESGKSLLNTRTAMRRTVMFFFCTNGGFATTRSEVRWRVSNLADRYAYYSKIEVSFMDVAGRPATREQSVEALPALLNTLMPVLWRDHYQDWDAVSRGEPPLVKPS
jgi:hypothetical protein